MATTSSAQVEKTPSATQLHVSNLPFTYDDADLAQIFSEFPIRHAYVATRRNGRSKGFGFVDFQTSDAQQKALSVVNGLELEGRTLEVNVAMSDPRRDETGNLREEFREALPKRTNARRGKAPASNQVSETILYVANFPFEYSEDDVSALFAAQSPVTVKIARRGDRSKGFGFVEFPDSASQQAALALDGHVINPGTEEERILSVQVSRVTDLAAPTRTRAPREPRERSPEEMEDSETTLYVSNLPFDLSDEGLTAIFSERGVNPTEARIARRRGGNQRSKGFGFVVFANSADQKQALAAVADVSLEDRPLSVEIARKGSEQPREERPRRRRTRAAGGAAPKERREPRQPVEKVPSDTLVYVSNLSFDLDDDQFGLIFAEYNPAKAYIARRRNGRSKGFGFVEFSTHEDQQRALSKHETTIADRTINVEVAKEPAVKEESQ